MSVMQRLLPKQVDNSFDGLRPALWLLGILIAMRLAMSLNSILNTADVAGNADGIPLASFSPEAARQVLLLFALMALGHLFLTLVALTALIRYRALVPFVYLVLLSEFLIRRVIVWSYWAPGVATTDTAFYVNSIVATLMTLGLILSLIPGRAKAA
jgi:hypothetical protein